MRAIRTPLPIVGVDFPVPMTATQILWPAPDPTSPYFIKGPALISFSGGRTSAFMLFQILWAHGGVLPPDVYVVFANTGKEREETLRFVHECEVRLGIRIWWIEWRAGADVKNAADRYEIVGYNSASRRGEPFRALIKRRRYLPNAVTRFCTAELKIETMKQFMVSMGYSNWQNIVGLRADEMRRVAKQQARNEAGKERWQSAWPLVRAGITKQHVWLFWLGRNLNPRAPIYPLPMGFDLGLWPYEGNCDHCFLKGRNVLIYQERERPGSLNDWIEMEDSVAARCAADGDPKLTGARFVTEYSYAELQREVTRSPLLIDIDPMHLEAEGECGVGGTDTDIRCGK